MASTCSSYDDDAAYWLIYGLAQHLEPHPHMHHLTHVEHPAVKRAYHGTGLLFPGSSHTEDDLCMCLPLGIHSLRQLMGGITVVFCEDSQPHSKAHKEKTGFCDEAGMKQVHVSKVIKKNHLYSIIRLVLEHSV